MVKNLFIAGTPGVGKTTLIKEVSLPYRERIGGFYTEEVRKDGERYAFLLKTFSGGEIIFAQKWLKSKYKVGKYGVDIQALEKVGVKALEEALAEKELVVIDEIGQMEILSDKFREVLVRGLNSEKNVLATIRFRSQPFTDELKKMDNLEVVHLTKENYPAVKNKVEKWLEEILF